MALTLTLTTAEVVRSIKAKYGVELSVWRIRRLFDSMELAGTLEVNRVCTYRVIDYADLDKIIVELQRLGILPTEAVASCPV